MRDKLGCDPASLCLGKHHPNELLVVIRRSPTTICRLERFDCARFLLRCVSGSCGSRRGCPASTYLAASGFRSCGLCCGAFLGFLAHNHTSFFEEWPGNRRQFLPREPLCRSHFLLLLCRADGRLTDAIEFPEIGN